jgi:hypothetical protein
MFWDDGDSIGRKYLHVSVGNERFSKIYHSLTIGKQTDRLLYPYNSLHVGRKTMETFGPQQYVGVTVYLRKLFSFLNIDSIKDKRFLLVTVTVTKVLLFITRSFIQALLRSEQSFPLVLLRPEFPGRITRCDVIMHIYIAQFLTVEQLDHKRR